MVHAMLIGPRLNVGTGAGEAVLPLLFFPCKVLRILSSLAMLLVRST
jgi:hypothetical protein